VPVIAGQQIVYTLSVVNLGPSNAQDVSISDAIPLSIIGAEFSTNGGTTWNIWTSPYSAGMLAVGSSVSIMIRGLVSASLTGNLVNTATVSSTTPDPVLTNNTSTVTSLVASSADMAITKTVNTMPVVAGQQIVYTLSVVNLGPSNAQDVSISDVVPASITSVQYSTNGGTTWNSWINPYNAGMLAVGSSVSLMIRGMIDASLTGNLVNTATVSSTTPDPVLSNNTSTVSSVVTSSADMQIIKTCLTSPVIAGMPIRYALTIQNNGPSTALGVMILDNVPVQILLPQYATSLSGPWLPWTGSYPLGTVLNAGTMTIYIQGTLIASASGSITNVANVTSTTPDPILANNTSTNIVTLNMLADLAITKTVNTMPVVAGQQIEYTLSVVNLGPSDAQNVTISDAVPAAITGAEYSTNSGATWNIWVNPYSAGTLPMGNSVSIMIRGIVNSSLTGNLVNTAIVSSTTPDPVLANNTSTVTSVVTTSADMAITKTCTTLPLAIGQQIIYTLLMVNLGPSDAQNVIITDTVPSLISNIQYSVDGGITWLMWTGNYNAGTLAALQSFSLLLSGIVISNPTGSISNTSTVSSTTPNPQKCIRSGYQVGNGCRRIIYIRNQGDGWSALLHPCTDSVNSDVGLHNGRHTRA